MFGGIEQELIAFGQQIIHLLPYANTCIGGFPVGEWAWILVIIEGIGQLIILRFKKVA
jgi:hypothetical protein